MTPRTYRSRRVLSDSEQAGLRRCRDYARFLCGGLIVSVWFGHEPTVRAIVDGDEEARAKVRRAFETLAEVGERFERERGETQREVTLARAFAEFAAAGVAFDEATRGESFDFDAIDECCELLERSGQLAARSLRR